jgi:hypothetical protein
MGLNVAAFHGFMRRLLKDTKITERCLLEMERAEALVTALQRTPYENQSRGGFRE